jgi:hypothetical protein
MPPPRWASKLHARGKGCAMLRHAAPCCAPVARVLCHVPRVTIAVSSLRSATARDSMAADPVVRSPRPTDWPSIVMQPLMSSTRDRALLTRRSGLLVTARLMLDSMHPARPRPSRWSRVWLGSYAPWGRPAQAGRGSVSENGAPVQSKAGEWTGRQAGTARSAPRKARGADCAGLTLQYGRLQQLDQQRERRRRGALECKLRRRPRHGAHQRELPVAGRVAERAPG